MQKYSREERENHLSTWRASGMSGQAYCRQHNIVSTTFYSWVKAEKNRAARELTSSPLMVRVSPQQHAGKPLSPQPFASKDEMFVSICQPISGRNHCNWFYSFSKQLMLLDLSAIEIYVRPGHTDMRKAINGLAVMVQDYMYQNPLSGSLYLFCNRQRRILKVLYWDRTGFCLWQKKLEKHKFPWPMTEENARQISTEQFSLLKRLPIP